MLWTDTPDASMLPPLAAQVGLVVRPAGQIQLAGDRAVMASITNWMCSSSSTPRSAAPRVMSSRLTAAAKPFCFNFFFTLEAVMPADAVRAAPCATAVMKPASSSQA